MGRINAASADLLRTILFACFFAIGASAMTLAFLTDDLVRYYNRRHQLAYADQVVRWLEQLNADYQSVIAQLQQDPDLLQRLAPAVIGAWPQEPNTAYPKARPRELMAARGAILTGEPGPIGPAQLPDWLSRCSRPYCRYTILVAGAGLVIVSFTCFSTRGSGQTKRGPKYEPRIPSSCQATRS